MATKTDKPVHPKCVYKFTKGAKRDTICNKNVLEENTDMCKAHRVALEKKAAAIESDDTPRCKSIIKSGTNKGQICNKAIKNKDPNIDKCMAHMKVKEDIGMEECTFIITRGERKGEPCAKKCKDGETLCSTHIISKGLTKTNLKKSSMNENKCSYVYKRGEKKGNTCDDKCYDDNILCKKHLKSSNSSEIESVISKASAKSTTSAKSVKKEVVEDDGTEEKSLVVQTCTYKITRGANAGKLCGGKTTNGSDVCSKHNKDKVSSSSSNKGLNEDEEKVSKDIVEDITKNLDVKPCKFNKDGKKCTKLAAVNSTYCKIHKSFAQKDEDEENDILKMIGTELNESEEEKVDDEDDE